MNIQEKAFFSSIAPLTNSMRIFGLYFTRYDEINNEKKSVNRWSTSQRYSFLVLILMWINVIRLMSSFNNLQGAVQAGIFFNLGLLAFIIVTTLMMTCFYMAYNSGRLDRLFREIIRYSNEEELDLRCCRHANDVTSIFRNDVIKQTSRLDDVISVKELDNFDRTSPDDVKVLPQTGQHGKGKDELFKFKEERDQKVLNKNQFSFVNRVAPERKKEFAFENRADGGNFTNLIVHARITAWCCVAVCWLWTISNVAMCSVSFFNSHVYDAALSPLITVIKVCDDVVMVAKCLYLIMYAYICAAWGYFASLTFLISTLFWREFQRFNKRFKSSLHRGRFVGNIELYRLRHQRLSRLVEKADKILCLHIGGSVVCHIVAFIVTLYALIWGPTLESAVTQHVLLFFYVASTAGHIGITTFGAILVNNSAYKLSEKINNIELSTLNAEQIGQVIVFQKRLNGSQIGFTILRFFVIDQSAILTITGALMTYFLLSMQLSPPPNMTSSGSFNYTS